MANKQWTLPGMCFDPGAPNKPKEGNISFPVNASVIMSGSSANAVHSGQAVDANLAANFINNFYTYYKIVQNGSAEHEKQSPAIEFEALNEQHVALKEHHKRTTNLSKAIHDLTYGMTLDKDMLLHIMSQKDCEGVRFYLCARQLENKEMQISLVAVGVDCDGCDLNYNKDSLKTDFLMPGLRDIATQSVTVEYTSPPPPGASSVSTKPSTADVETIDDRYALLKLARGNQPPPAYQPTSDFILLI